MKSQEQVLVVGGSPVACVDWWLSGTAFWAKLQ